MVPIGRVDSCGILDADVFASRDGIVDSTGILEHTYTLHCLDH